MDFFPFLGQVRENYFARRETKKMPLYPLRIPLKRYRGHNPRTLHKLQRESEMAAILEDYINGKFCEDEPHGYNVQVFDYDSISIDTGIDHRIIRNLLSLSEGGNSGITIFNKKHLDEIDSSYRDATT
ncbi:MAG: hypothetical protein AB1916_10915 [Thermodesulfobacteriota bacterium]